MRRAPPPSAFRRLRAASPALAATLLVSFVSTFVMPLSALAAPAPDDAKIEAPPPPVDAPSPNPPANAPSPKSGNPAGEAANAPAPVNDADEAAGTKPITGPIKQFPSSSVALDLPSGGDHTGVSSQSISVPQGAGKIQGMGESFSAQLSTGIGTFSVPISLLPARGAASPSLGLSYTSSGGHGLAGVGWDIGVPSIQRQTDRGNPRYDDPPVGGAWHANQDRFVFNGGQELIPICQVKASSCAGALPDEAFPGWLEGWQYFRPRVEGGFLRFFWSPDHKTWRVQDKSGVMMELGGTADSVEADPGNAAHIFKWNLSRQTDPHTAGGAVGDPAAAYLNPVVYRYAHDGELAYLTDIYDTPPVASPTAPIEAWAHHTRLRYEARTDPTVSYRRGWATSQKLRLAGIDVTSKAFDGAGARKLVRRYHLSYDASFHPSLLTKVQLEGRCPVGAGMDIEAAQPVVEDPEGALPDGTSCPRLPPMTFDYQHVAPFNGDGTAGVPDLVGYEGFDERVHAFSGSPKYSIDDGKTGLFDVNADALPDVLVTLPGDFQGSFGVFFNGSLAAGKPDSFSQDCVAVQGVNNDTAGALTFQNPNLAPLDVDGDGIVDLLHMPKVKTYSLYNFVPSTGACTTTLKGRSIDTASQQNAKIDFSTDAADLRVMDVNGDGMVDVVLSQGTQYQTFFALGRYPEGDGQFGAAKWASGTTSTISNLPVATCVPWAGTPIKLSDADVRVGDMNGDGYPDIVRIHQGDIRYWPGRGDGTWGTGSLDCPAGTFGSGRDIAMTQSPEYSDINLGGIRLDDVNGDGLDDLVQVRFDGVDVWLNMDGAGFTPNRHILAKTPASPAFQSRVRLVDMNGSGTRDIVWGDGLGYKYIDLSGGKRPWVLTHVENGLGKTTDIDYGSSPQLMLAAAAAGNPWSSVTPMALHVVTKVTERDNLAIVGRPAGEYVTTYEYRDPVYDGRQREFRGFKDVRVRRVGDDNSPSATTRSLFLLGECVPLAGGEECTPEHRWMDNPREALKGLPAVSESYDDFNVYRSTTHHQYRLRKLYDGLDGRAVRHAYEAATDAYSYDTGPFSPGGASATQLQDVAVQDLAGTVTPEAAYKRAVAVQSAKAALIQSTSEVDLFGNATVRVALGCTSGCATPDEQITSHSVPALPPGDPTGWMWRTTDSWVTGSIHLEERKRTHVTYDALGQPTDTSAVLAGTAPLQRSHESGGAVAATPVTASAPGAIPISQQDYDAFGNVLSQFGANGRCRTMAYDPAFGDLTASETVFVGPVPFTPGQFSCGPTALTSNAVYDRGLGAVTQVSDIHTELTTTRYDGFGRLIELHKPDPKNVGQASSAASVLIEYFLTADAKGQPYSRLHTRTQDGADENDTSHYLESWAVVDGMGRTIVTLQEADSDPLQDGYGWIVNGLTEYDNKGAARRAYLAWFWTGEPMQFPLDAPSKSPYGRQRYDAFGRQIETYGLDGSVTLKSVHHALSKDLWDAADLTPGPHQGTYASERMDGHGRSIATIERIHVGGKIEARETQRTYLPTGPVETITRVRGADSVQRWMRYDTLDRMVLNVEPSTTKGVAPAFSLDPSGDGAITAWRYAYDDAGDLVGTSDARGCGSNFHYDSAGRLLAEDYSPCLDIHPAYSTPDLASGVGAEVFYVYDGKDADSPPEPAAPTAEPPPGQLHIDGSLLLGRLASVTDRASKTVTSFDGRGRVIGVGRKIAAPKDPSDPDDPNRFQTRWYTSYTTYDGADRPVNDSTGAATPTLQGAGNKSVVSSVYGDRGTVKQVLGSYGGLVGRVTHDADGLVGVIEYGDLAKTSTAYSYDNRRRVHSVQTYRGPPDPWKASPHPETQQTLLEDLDYTYDVVDNPTEIRDWRVASEWPDGAKPVSRKIAYDDLYRATQVDYLYAAGTDDWTSPFAADLGSTDPLRPKPSPHVAFDKRVLEQTFTYDWLGNTTHTGDDASGFYDRSLGAVTNDPAKRYQLKSATQAGPRGGSLGATYDDAGNLVALDVVRSGPCLPTAASCEQKLRYDWDEVGRLQRARRFDGGGTASGTPAVELRYAYDAHDQRVRKTAVDGEGSERHTVYVFDSLELRRAAWTVDPDTATLDYERTDKTETVYLLAHGVRLARLAYHAPDSLPGGVASVTDGLHVFLELGDHLGSTAIVLDKNTGELVEAGTYTAYGSAESDYRPERWGSFREDYRFTGKEEDAEVGLTYFGKRYLSPALGRWISADPLAVHGGGADLNLYAYVRGLLVGATDPVGLQERGTDGVAGVVVGTTQALVPGGAPQLDKVAPENRTFQFFKGAGRLATGVAEVYAGIAGMIGGGGAVAGGAACAAPSGGACVMVAASGAVLAIASVGVAAQGLSNVGAGAVGMANAVDPVSLPDPEAAANTPAPAAGGTVAAPPAPATPPRPTAPVAQTSPASGGNIKKNAADGRMRDKIVTEALKQESGPGASVQSERVLRDGSGKVAKDPVTGKARVIDKVVIRKGAAERSVEITSTGASKTAQMDKEARIRAAGGTFVRDKSTGKMVDLSETPTEVVRRP